ncbi:MAG: GAF domain-containing protein [Deltaproteobacteria bacterium]|nr:GAF domain-containing protein [Deltaproteobacteria bacterium]
MDVKNIAVIGANKDGLRLLPLLLKDRKSRVCMIADSNRDAMLFKLNELGYGIAGKHDIKLSSDLEDIKKIKGLDIIINTLQDQTTERFLDSAEFKDVEKLNPLSTRLLWGVRANAPAKGEVMDRANEQAALLSAFREIVDAVRLTIDRKELLSVILKLVTESTRAERGSIMLVSEEEGTLRVEIAKGMDEEVVRKIRVPLGEGISGKVASEGKPRLIAGKAKGEDFERPMDRSDVKSAMSVPLVVSGETIGVINVSSSESTHAFTSEDLNFLSSMAALAAEVIKRSNEYERLRVDAAKFTFWKEVDSIMSSPLPIDRRLNSVARKLVGIVEGLTFFIYTYDEDRKRLFLAASSIKDSGKSLGQLSLRPGEGLEGSSIESMRDVFLVDRTEEGATKRVYLSLPMISNGKVVGTLNGQVISPKGLSKYQEAFLKEIRSLIAESVYKFNANEKEKQRARKMFAVDEAGLEMISIKDPRKLLTVLVTTPAAIIGGEGSLLRVKHNGSKMFQTAATYGLDDEKIRECFLPIEKETVMEVLRKKETVMREFSEEASPYIRSILSIPLRAHGNIVAVLSLFNKTSEGALYPCGFAKADSDILVRFSVYADKALLNIIGSAPKEVRERGEVNQSPVSAFAGRVEQEMERSRRYGKSFVLATVRVSGLKAFSPQRKAELEACLVGHMRKKMRNFDIIMKLSEETFGFLFLDTNEKVMRLLASVTDAIATEDFFNRSLSDGRIEVLCGYAVFPHDGMTFQDLFSKASKSYKLDKETTYDT